MTNFPYPLPRPIGEGVDIPPRLTDGVTFQVRTHPALIPNAMQVQDHWVWRHEREPSSDGVGTFCGFSIFWLDELSPGLFQIVTCDYADDDLANARTDDLTTALWIEASQDDVLRRSGLPAAETTFGDQVMITKAAFAALGSGGDTPLFLERKGTWDTDESDSGWVLSVPGTKSRRDKRMTPALAAQLVKVAPFLIPFLQLPGNSLVTFSGQRPTGVYWTPEAILKDAGVEFASENTELFLQRGVSVLVIDGEGNGAGTQSD